jgi:hypothetical protein
MPKKRGNPNCGRPMRPASVLCTEFEMQARHLRVAPEEYVASARLREWCEENKNQHYIPEWLLKAWNISVNSDLSGAAVLQIPRGLHRRLIPRSPPHRVLILRRSP